MTEQDTRTAIIRSSIPHNRWPGVPPRQSLGVLAILSQLEHSQWWPAEVLQARQFLQLDSLLRFACKSVPYYRERFARIGWKAGEPLTSEIWSELPLLRRSDIEEHARDLLAGSMTAHGKRRFCARETRVTCAPIRATCSSCPITSAQRV